MNLYTFFAVSYTLSNKIKYYQEKERNLIMTDTKQLKDEELKKVTGGDGPTTYKYVFTNKDWVYDSGLKTMIIRILESVSTNDDYKKILCIKEDSENRSYDLYNGNGAGNYTVTAKKILDCYKNFGGDLDAME